MKKFLISFMLFGVISTAYAKTCPDGGQISPINPSYCCKGSRVESYYSPGINRETQLVYATFAPNICGCPDGGTLSKDKRTCCKNGYAYDGYLSESKILHGNYTPEDLKKGEYAYLDTESCGCPIDMEEKNGICCQNGWEGNDYNPWKCGCPDGGVMDPKDGVCKKNHFSYFWAQKKYAGLNPEQDGCPDGSTQIDNICCKNNFAYDNETMSWNKADSRCGCPDGGEKSLKTGHGFPAIYPCCKNGLMYSSDTGKYDTENNFYCHSETYKIPTEKLRQYENDSEAFFKYWQNNQNLFKKKADEKHPNPRYPYERNYK